MKYKSLLLDVDGTLCQYSTSEMPIMPSIEVINSIQSITNEIYVGLATSRPLSKIEHLIRTIGFNGYSILSNGAQIIDSKTLRTIWKKSINPHALNQLFDIAQKYSIDVYIYDFEKNIHLESKDQLSALPIADFFFDGIENIHLESVEENLSHISDIAVHKMNSKWKNKSEISITNIEASKKIAVFKVAELLELQPFEIIGVGDGYNDISLLEACGLKIAMGNAVEPLKEIADFIAPPVEHDGVKFIIKTFLQDTLDK